MSEFNSLFLKDKRPAASDSSALGAKGEAAAAAFLETSSYKLMASNFRIPVGRNSKGVQVTGEIDIVAMDGDVLCFIEVKTRRSDEFAAPEENVTLRKQRQITRTARIYRRVFGLSGIPHRFDVVSVLLPERGRPQVTILKNFWSESKFRKNSWRDDIFVN
jgi:putative endonuclease